MKRRRYNKIFMVVVFVFITCSSHFFTSALASTTIDEPLLLKVSTYASKAVNWTKAAMWFYEEVERLSAGRIKFEYYYSGTLLPARETITGLKSGVADIAVIVPEYTPGKTPLSVVTSLPMTGKYWYSTAMALPGFFSTPELKSELDQFNMMYLSHAQVTSYGIWSNSEIKGIGDLKGKKLSVSGLHAQLLKSLGAVPYHNSV
jgi:TRAP-type C4-dicarboxylate transport system substrate-binding protein